MRLKAGLNIMFPVKIGAWQAEPMALRRRLGREWRIFGGIDKRALLKGREEVDAEIERRLPLMKQGGHIPLPDHLIPPGVTVETYRYYLERIAALRF